MSNVDPLVSVVVLNWNGRRFLDDCLGSLLRQNFTDYEVLLVDNGSTDDSLDFVRETFSNESRLRVIELGANFGFSKGNNLGVDYARGKYIIVLNNDTTVREGFVRELVGVAESDSRIASVGCRVLSVDGGTWFSQKFMNGGFIVPLFLQNLVRSRVDYVSDRCCVNLANSGCACLFRKAAFWELGGYDEDFVADWEDWDLGYRINLAGYKSVYIPAALVIHCGGGSFGYPPDRYARIYRNTLLTHFKNYDVRNLILRFSFFALILLPLSHIGFIVRQLLVGNRKFNRSKMLSYFLSLARAYSMFLRELRVFSKKRFVIQKLRRKSDREVFRSTLSRYFL